MEAWKLRGGHPAWSTLSPGLGTEDHYFPTTSL